MKAAVLDHPRVADYLSARAAFAGDEIECRDRGLELYSPDALAEGQLGYAIGADGEDLTGSLSGGWRPSWLTIGHEDLLGDPVFVDLDTATLEAFTAPHGTDAWEPERIADSVDAFFAALARVRDVEVGTLDPDEALAAIAADSPRSSREFWRDWVEGDQDSDSPDTRLPS